jgi:hypothetical protein
MQYNFSSLFLNVLFSLIVLLGNDAVRRQLGCIFNQTNIGRNVTTFPRQQLSQTSWYSYQTTRRHISEDCEFLNHGDGNTKSHEINSAQICTPFVFKIHFNIILIPNLDFTN